MTFISKPYIVIGCCVIAILLTLAGGERATALTNQDMTNQDKTNQDKTNQDKTDSERPIDQESSQQILLSDLDLPLMDGLVEENDNRIIFDTPEGRIIETRAKGSVKILPVLDYYRLILPSLAWRIIGTNGAEPLDEANCEAVKFYCIIAKRDREILTIRVGKSKANPRITVVRFMVNPR